MNNVSMTNDLQVLRQIADFRAESDKQLAKLVGQLSEAGKAFYEVTVNNPLPSTLPPSKAAAKKAPPAPRQVKKVETNTTAAKPVAGGNVTAVAKVLSTLRVLAKKNKEGVSRKEITEAIGNDYAATTIENTLATHNDTLWTVVGTRAAESAGRPVNLYLPV